MNLQTRYLGLDLKSPLVAAASPLSRDLDGIRRLEDAGAAAIVLFSLFAEQVTGEPRVPAYNQFGNDPLEEAHSFAPEAAAYYASPDAYLNLVAQAKMNVGVPIIASLNATESGDWIPIARHLQSAGADALELNVYRFSADPDSSAEVVERQILDLVRAVRHEITIPLAAKLLPYFTSLGNLSRSLCMDGVDGLVLFNWLYQPDIDLVNLESSPNRDPGGMNDLRLPLHWTSILYGRVHADIAVSGGIRSHVDVLKALATGGTVAMLATELLRRGVGRLTEIEFSITGWMERNGYESLAQMRGCMSKLRIADPAAFARLHYIREVQSYRPPARIVQAATD